MMVPRGDHAHPPACEEIPIEPPSADDESVADGAEDAPRDDSSSVDAEEGVDADDADGASRRWRRRRSEDEEPDAAPAGPRHSVRNSSEPRLTVAELAEAMAAEKAAEDEPTDSSDALDADTDTAEADEVPKASSAPLPNLADPSNTLPPGTDLGARLAAAAADVAAAAAELGPPEPVGRRGRLRRGASWLFAPASRADDDDDEADVPA